MRIFISEGEKAPLLFTCKFSKRQKIEPSQRRVAPHIFAFLSLTITLFIDRSHSFVCFDGRASGI